MELRDLIERQRQFDAARSTTFDWSMPFSGDDTRSLSHNALALAGEVGEFANLVKKYERGDLAYEELSQLLPMELADIFIYVLKIAYQGGIDLEAAFENKLTENESRFPASKYEPSMARGVGFFDPEKLAHSGDTSKLRHAVERAAGSLSFALTEEDATSVRRIFQLSGVESPGARVDMLTACLAMLIYVKAYDFQGDQERRNAVWAAIQPLTSSVGLSKRDVVSLTEHAETISQLLSIGPKN